MSGEFNALRSNLPRYRHPTVVDLCVKTISVESDTNNLDVWDLFTAHRELIILPVLEGDIPIGLINRTIFMSQMSKPFHRELYCKKSCIAFMDKDPLIVDSTMTIEELTFRAVEFGERALADGFIITLDGKLEGVGFGLDLMKVVANLQAEKNRQIMQSIDYASVIQTAMLRTSHEALSKAVEDAYLVWQPRDVVGGDFHHFCVYPDGWFAAIADCTGHGVPGAFMTLIASTTLAKALQERGPKDPAALFMDVNRGIKETLGQVDGREDSSQSNDGLDAAFVWFERSSGKLTFAGARIGLWVLDPSKAGFEITDGERTGIGYLESPFDYQWTNKTIELASGSLIFMTTDGMIDQIGGPQGISFGKRRIRDAILKQRSGTTEQISQGLLSEYTAWQGEQRRRDDVTFVCIRS
ncbi:serine phosphatase RsbU (regulator of sigma subunit) [Oxalobacteraceae bacterium GrIS 2.11]